MCEAIKSYWKEDLNTNMILRVKVAEMQDYLRLTRKATDYS